MQFITYTNVCILRFFDSRRSRAYYDKATNVMCVVNVIFGQERLTEQFFLMRFFYDSVILFAKRCSSLSEQFAFTRSFCESVLFADLKVLRGGELCLVRTVGIVRLDEILFEILSKKWH